MNQFRNIAWGFLIVLLGALILFGAFTASMAETGLGLGDLFPTLTHTSILPPDQQPFTATGAPVLATSQILPTPTAIVLVDPTSSLCPYPIDWIVIKITPDDSLAALALQYNTTIEILVEGNCWLTQPATLTAGEFRVPPVEQVIVSAPTSEPPDTATPSPTLVKTLASSPTACIPPAGWVLYTVQQGDNLYRIGLAYGVSVVELQRANCMVGVISIYVGQKIYVPNVPTRTPVQTNTATSTLVPTNTATATMMITTPPPATFTPTHTATITPTSTSTLTPPATQTPVPTNTPTNTPPPTETVPPPSSTAPPAPSPTSTP